MFEAAAAACHAGAPATSPIPRHRPAWSALDHAGRSFDTWLPNGAAAQTGLSPVAERRTSVTDSGRTDESKKDARPFLHGQGGHNQPRR